MMNRPAPRRKDLSTLRDQETLPDRTQISTECTHPVSANSGMGKALNQFLIKRREKVGT